MKLNLLIIISLCTFLRASAQETISASIPFAINSAILSNIEKKHILDLITSYSIERIQLTGHTDNIGNNTYNLDLSKKRVQAVSDYLFQ
jgi:outer membrane protein OmpA-like peptidoglycan-associated protein